MTRNASAELLEVLDRLGAEDFRMGPAWKHAHQVAQAHEGDRLFDRLHALCHRIEGDDGNAGYWYRRASIEPFSGSFSEEAASIRESAG